MTNASDWIVENPEKIKKPRKKPQRDKCKKVAPSTAMVRIAEKAEIYETPWEQNNLYASNICDENWDLTNQLIKFWEKPKPIVTSLSKRLYTEQSNVKHKIWQEHYHSAGVLHPICGKEQFKEPRCFFKQYGISGRIDLILPDGAYLKALGAKTPKELPEIKGWFCADIKETDENRYKEVNPEFPATISQKYWGQISLYIKWGFDEGLTDEKVGYFVYLNRNMPLQPKVFAVEYRQDLVRLAFDRADEFWDHVNSKDIPNGPPKEWVDDQIKLQKGRKWPKLFIAG